MCCLRCDRNRAIWIDNELLLCPGIVFLGSIRALSLGVRVAERTCIINLLSLHLILPVDTLFIQLARVLVDIFWQTPGKAEIANLGLAAQIHKDVGGFDISVDQVGRVHEVERAKHVVHYCQKML